MKFELNWPSGFRKDVESVDEQTNDRGIDILIAPLSQSSPVRVWLR